MRQYGGVHFQRGRHINTLHKRWCGKRHRAAHQRDVRAAFGCRGSNRKAHFAGAVVGDVTHRIQRLARGARGNHDVEMLQIVDRREMGGGHINNR